MLLNEGECSPNLRNGNGCTPLHMAAEKGKVYVIELLLNHPDIDVVSGSVHSHIYVSVIASAWARKLCTLQHFIY